MDEDKILEYVQTNGPILPKDVKDLLKIELLFASAYLSELVSRKKIKFSSFKVGGSPVYYLEGQEQQLHQFIPQLTQKEQETLSLLKEKKVIRENEAKPHLHIFMSLKDFAIPLRVTTNGTQEVFWAWSGIPEVEAVALIKQTLANTPLIIKTPSLQEAFSVEEQHQKKETPAPFSSSPNKTFVAHAQGIEQRPVLPQAESKEVKDQPKESSVKLASELASSLQDKFVSKVANHLGTHSIKIKECSIIRKSAEANLVASVPTGIGHIDVFIKAKDKKLVNEKEIFAAFIEAEMKRLPLVFIYTGSLNKKVNLINRKEYRNMTFYKL